MKGEDAGAPPAGEGALDDPEILRLAREADAETADPAPGEEGEGTLERLPALTLERELAGMFAMIGAGAGQFLPSVKVVLDDGTCKSLGDAIAPVARKYGLDRYLSGFKWRVELQALMVVGPVAFALRQAVAHDLEQYRKAAAADAAGGLGEASATSSSASAAPGKPEMLKPVAP